MNNKTPIFFKEAANLWLATKQAKIKKSSYYQYHCIIQNHIVPALGNTPMDQIDNQMVCQFLNSINNDRQPILSSSSLKSIIYVTKAVIRYTIQMEMMPEIKIYFESPGKGKERDAILSYQEEESLYQYLLQYSSSECTGIILAMYTGIRLGELCALQWKNINLQENCIYIEKTAVRIPSLDTPKRTVLSLEAPKSISSIRCIPLTDFVTTLLKEKGKYHLPEEFLVNGKMGKIPDPRTMHNHFKRYEKNAGIKTYNFHTLRHTFATRCVELDFDIKSLSEILGHASVNITLNRYVHSSMEMKRRQMMRLQQYQEQKK